MHVSKRRGQKLHARLINESLRVRRLGKNRVQINVRQPVLTPLNTPHFSLDGNTFRICNLCDLLHPAYILPGVMDGRVHHDGVKGKLQGLPDVCFLDAVV